MLESLTGEIIGAALRIHRDLGPGLLESVYEAMLAAALTRKGRRSDDSRTSRFRMMAPRLQTHSA